MDELWAAAKVCRVANFHASVSGVPPLTNPAPKTFPLPSGRNCSISLASVTRISACSGVGRNTHMKDSYDLEVPV